jgi:hypothetical protein
VAFSYLCADIGHVQLIDEFKKSHPLAKNFALEAEVLQAKQKMLTSGEPYAILGTASHAKEKFGTQDESFEYSVGIAKTFLVPHASEILEGVISRENKVSLLEKKQELISYMYELLDLYHQSCLQRETVTLFQQLSLQLEELQGKNERAFELGEISKKDLILWHLQQQRITLEFEKKESERLQIFRTLQSKFGSKLKIKKLTCSDLYDFKLPEQSRSFEDLLEMKRVRLLRDRYAMQSEAHPFHEIGVGISYDNEIDMERYNLSLNVPLEFTASHHEGMAEMNRLQALQRDNEIVTFEMQKRKELQSAYLKLEQAYESYNALEGPMSEDAIKLMELTHLAYQSGESTAIELITIQQYVMDILMQLQELKYQFYGALFDYYKRSITGEEF